MDATLTRIFRGPEKRLQALLPPLPAVAKRATNRLERALGVRRQAA